MSQHQNNFIVMLVILFHQLMVAVAAMFTLVWTMLGVVGLYFIVGPFLGWVRSTVALPHWMTAGVGLSGNHTAPTVLLAFIAWSICIVQDVAWLAVTRHEAVLIEHYLATNEEYSVEISLAPPEPQEQIPFVPTPRRLSMRRATVSIRRMSPGRKLKVGRSAALLGDRYVAGTAKMVRTRALEGGLSR